MRKIKTCSVCGAPYVGASCPNCGGREETCRNCDYTRDEDPRCMCEESQWAGCTVKPDNYCGHHLLREENSEMRDTAQKPEISYDFKKGENRMLHRCPRCGRLICFYEFGFSSTENGLPEERRLDECPDCGQKIDWSGIPRPGEHDIWAGTYGKSESTPPALRATSPYTGEALGVAEGRKTRLIDATTFEKSIQLSIESWGRDCNSNAPAIVRTYKDVLSRLGYAPTVDAMEVVRCKDCRKWESASPARDDGFCHNPKFHIHYGHVLEHCFMPLTKSNDFCSYGVRKVDTGGDSGGGGITV